ncbi:MAG: hypothetical protein HGA76_06650 [Candidatus Firestonebacteria bacterium]|nr:hypothetical protein [Candidatus Firestonebacteria bacterium]
MHPNRKPESNRSGRFFQLALVLSLALAGCVSVPARLPEPSAPQTWSGPDEFSADYLWEVNRAAVAYDRPVKLVRLVVRRARAVRAVGIDVFGATIFDEMIQNDPSGKLQTRFRQGAENVDGLLLEQTLRRIFFNAPSAAGVRWLKHEAGAGGQPAALLGMQIGNDKVELQLIGATVGPQTDADFVYPAAP